MAGRGNKRKPDAPTEHRGTPLQLGALGRGQLVRTIMTRSLTKRLRAVECRGAPSTVPTSSSSSSEPPRSSSSMPDYAAPSFIGNQVGNRTVTPSQRVTSNTAVPMPATSAAVQTQPASTRIAIPTGGHPSTSTRAPVAPTPSTSTATSAALALTRPIGVNLTSSTSRFVLLPTWGPTNSTPVVRVSPTPSNSRATPAAPGLEGATTPAQEALAPQNGRPAHRRTRAERDDAMIGQNIRRQLLAYGINVFENNANATVPTAGPSASTSANTARNRTLFEVIIPLEIHNIYHLDKHFTVLLIDSRTPEKFNKSKVKYSVNAAFDPTNVSSSDIRFNLKSDVVKFIQVNCPSLIGVLNAPGFYKNLIIYDDASTATKQTRSVEILIGAMAKWNGGTGTKIRLLQGGFETMAVRYQHLLCYAPAPVPTLPAIWTFTSTMRNLSSFSSIPGAPQQSSHQAIDRLTIHINNLDTSTAKTEKILDLKRKLKSMEAVKSALQEEEAIETFKRLEPLVSDNVKCPICYDIFAGQIIQCLNGHCFCHTCSGRLGTCPECRVSFARGQVRNLGMERVISNIYKVHCPYSLFGDRNGCNEEMLLKDITAHLGSCVNRPKSGEVQTIENEMRAGLQEIGRLNAELGDINKIIMETEMEINSQGIDQLVPGVDPKLMEKLFENYRKSTQARMAVILETFMKQNNHTE